MEICKEIEDQNWSLDKKNSLIFSLGKNKFMPIPLTLEISRRKFKELSVINTVFGALRGPSP